MPRPFLALYKVEQQLLTESPAEDVRPRATLSDGSAEPRISYAPYDRVGLALSGGGIRSATFNVGILQGLHQLRLLPLFDDLSTVSGGGYIGGWWTAWRCRPQHRDDLADQPFPQAQAGVEAPEVRHLREFSKFLLPRVGFFEIDTWNGIVVVLGGALVGIAAANAVLMGDVELAPHGAGQQATDSLHADLIDFYLGAGFRLSEDGTHLLRDA